MGKKPIKKTTKKPKIVLTEQQQKCLDCRECCEYVEYPITMLSTDVVEYFLIRGDQFYINSAGVLFIRKHSPCQHLSETGGCLVYNERSFTCRDFMCDEKDKRVKEVKDAACKKCLAEVKIVIENHNKKKAEEEEGKNVGEN